METNKQIIQGKYKLNLPAIKVQYIKKLEDSGNEEEGEEEEELEEKTPEGIINESNSAPINDEPIQSEKIKDGLTEKNKVEQQEFVDELPADYGNRTPEDQLARERYIKDILMVNDKYKFFIDVSEDKLKKMPSLELKALAEQKIPEMFQRRGQEAVNVGIYQSFAGMIEGFAADTLGMECRGATSLCIRTPAINMAIDELAEKYKNGPFNMMSPEVRLTILTVGTMINVHKANREMKKAKENNPNLPIPMPQRPSPQQETKNDLVGGFDPYNNTL